jgi:hypothetical protein
MPLDWPVLEIEHRIVVLKPKDFNRITVKISVWLCCCFNLWNIFKIFLWKVAKTILFALSKLYISVNFMSFSGLLTTNYQKMTNWELSTIFNLNFPLGIAKKKELQWSASAILSVQKISIFRNLIKHSIYNFKSINCRQSRTCTIWVWTTS